MRKITAACEVTHIIKLWSIQGESEKFYASIRNEQLFLKFAIQIIINLILNKQFFTSNFTESVKILSLNFIAVH